jgi:outer membrane protein assembly factor BamB
VYFGSYDGGVYAVDTNGTLKWHFQTAYIVSSSPAVGSDGTVYVGSWDRNLYALNANGTQKWKFTTGDGIDSSPALGGDGTVYFGSHDGNLYAVTSAGSEKWAFSTGSAVLSSPAIGADGTIYFGSSNGSLYAVNSSDGSEKWIQPVVGGSSSPAIGSDGTIYIASTLLYALGQTSVSFGNFTGKLDITKSSGTFDLNSSFSLGTGSNGINPVSETVTLQMGSYSVNVPTGSFIQDKNGVFVFEGTIAGAALQFRINPTGPNSYTLQAEGIGASLGGISNPVPVTLTIGDDTGTTTITADIS